MKKLTFLTVLIVLIAAARLGAGDTASSVEQQNMHNQTAPVGDESRVPPLDRNVPGKLSTAVFGMG